MEQRHDQDFDPDNVRKTPAGLHPGTAPVVPASDYDLLLEAYQRERSRADRAEQALHATLERTSTSELINRVISCPHAIDPYKIILHYDGTRPGHNALNQLSRRLDEDRPSASVASPIAVDSEILDNANRYRMLRDVLPNAKGLRPIVVMVADDLSLMISQDVLQSARYGFQLDREIDRLRADGKPSVQRTLESSGT